MILADKIMCLRKQKGWSQEELANKMNVSRQSVSKWESESAVPDMDKIVMLSDIFKVSTDYLLKEDMKEDCIERTVQIQEVDETVSLTYDETTKYIETVSKFGKLIAWGVTLCILGPTILIFFSEVEDFSFIDLSFRAAMSISLTSLFVLVAIAVMMFIKGSTMMEDFDKIKGKEVVLNPSDKRHIEELLSNYKWKYNLGITTGVSMFILCVIPLIISSLYDASDITLIMFVVLLMAMVNLGVHIIIIVSTVKGGYDTLLNKGVKTKQNREVEEMTERIGAIYWPLVVAIYLFWSFYTMDWGITWIVWPVAGVLFGVVYGISGFLVKK